MARACGGHRCCRRHTRGETGVHARRVRAGASDACVVKWRAENSGMHSREGVMRQIHEVVENTRTRMKIFTKLTNFKD